MTVLVPIGAGVLAFIMVAITAGLFWGLAFLPAGLFWWAVRIREGRWGRSGWIHTAAVSWVGYGLWERLIQTQVVCDAECNIRIDLVLFLPTLVVASILGARQAVRLRSKSNSEQPPP